MTPAAVARLVRDGRLERVAADVAAAWPSIREAKKHLKSAAALATEDPSLAYVALYDAARKAIAAHMQAHGYRVAKRAGAHQAVGMYAEAVLTTKASGSHVRRFDRMRQIRNRSEYEGFAVGEQMVLTDLSHARAIVSAAQAALPPQP